MSFNLYIQKLRLWGNGLKKNQTTPSPSEHSPVMGEKINTFSK